MDQCGAMAKGGSHPDGCQCMACGTHRTFESLLRKPKTGNRVLKEWNTSDVKRPEEEKPEPLLRRRNGASSCRALNGASAVGDAFQQRTTTTPPNACERQGNRSNTGRADSTKRTRAEAPAAPVPTTRRRPEEMLRSDLRPADTRIRTPGRPNSRSDVSSREQPAYDPTARALNARPASRELNARQSGFARQRSGSTGRMPPEHTQRNSARALRDVARAKPQPQPPQPQGAAALRTMDTAGSDVPRQNTLLRAQGQPRTGSTSGKETLRRLNQGMSATHNVPRAHAKMADNRGHPLHHTWESTHLAPNAAPLSQEPQQQRVGARGTPVEHRESPGLMRREGKAITARAESGRMDMQQQRTAGRTANPTVHQSDPAVKDDFVFKGAPPPGVSEFEEMDVQLFPCRTCGRSFNSLALTKHTRVCKKVFVQKRKPLDVVALRRPDDAGAPPMISKQSSSAHKKPPPNNWRQKSESFRSAIRASRQIKAATEGRGVMPGFVPTPAELDDRTPCPHCGRKFSSEAAERHIPKCKDIKAKPTRLLRGTARR